MTWDVSSKRIFLIGGPGGVGKTTVAASLAVSLSLKGYRTLVLTVDPAKRLAQALGLKDFDKALQTVNLPDAPSSKLTASMLDSQHYFDKVIERFARSEEQKDKIKQNRLYRTMVESLGGTHEYAAMERLLEFASNTDYDKIVVDTPPTQNALDLLQAPQRLANFMDNSVLKWFQKKGGFHFFQKGTQLAMRALQTILGGEFIDNLALFLNDLEGMQTGFRERHLAVLDLLRHPSTAFVLVTQPSEARLLETLEFQKVLQKEQIHLEKLILNRMEPNFSHLNFKNLTADNRAWFESWAHFLAELHLVQTKWAAAFGAALKVPTSSISRSSTAMNHLSALIQIGTNLLEQ